MARVDVIMPQMGESIAEGTMSKWLKQVGDAVKRDEPIFEISTDKVDAEIPAPIAGMLAEVLVTEGQTVAVGTVVGRIETEAGAAVAAPQAAAAAPPAAAAQPAAPKPETPPAPNAAPAAPLTSARPAPALPAAQVRATAPQAVATETAEERLRRKSTPLVRKMVEEHHLDLGAIPGTGSAGRVTRQDVLSYLESGTAQQPASQGDGATSAAPAPPRVPAAPAASQRQVAEVPRGAGAPLGAPPESGQVPRGAGVPLGTATGAAGQAPPTAMTPVAAWDGDRVEPWNRVRRITAEHMVLSRRVSAHVNSLIEIDFTHIANLRKRQRESFAERGVNLTFLAFIVKAVAENLRSHPVINAAVSGENTVYRRDINIGIAVALDWGLIVPVIHHADELSLLGIARGVQDVAERARGKRLMPEDIQRGTFSITNPGGFGTYVGTPIINQPQVAILAIGAIEKRPSVVTLPDGNDTIAIRTKGMLCLAYDHRVVDGADADRFLADVRRTLQAFPEHQG
ncbi:MAG: dihydrolipoamide acetyltransferase family protein [Gemmatimonadales bacterium]